MFVTICLVGPPGAGKSAAAEYIRTMFGAVVKHPADPVKSMLTYIGKSVTRSEIRQSIMYLHSHFSDTILADILVNGLHQIPNPIVVIDGIRMKVAHEYLRSHLNPIHTVSIDAPVDVRFVRRRTDAEAYTDDRVLTLSQFRALHDDSFEKETPQLMMRSDYSIDNSGTHDEFYEQIDSVVRDILSRVRKSVLKKPR